VRGYIYKLEAIAMAEGNTGSTSLGF